MPHALLLSLESVKEAVREACLHRPVIRVEAFGSLSRGEFHEGSDVDLLVEFSQPIGLFEMGDLKEELESALGVQVDLLSRKAVEMSTNPYRRRAILADLIPVYVR